MTEFYNLLKEENATHLIQKLAPKAKDIKPLKTMPFNRNGIRGDVFARRGFDSFVIGETFEQTTEIIFENLEEELVEEIAPFFEEIPVFEIKYERYDEHSNLNVIRILNGETKIESSAIVKYAYPGFSGETYGLVNYTFDDVLQKFYPMFVSYKEKRLSLLEKQLLQKLDQLETADKKGKVRLNKSIDRINTEMRFLRNFNDILWSFYNEETKTQIRESSSKALVKVPELVEVIILEQTIKALAAPQLETFDVEIIENQKLEMPEPPRVIDIDYNAPGGVAHITALDFIEKELILGPYFADERQWNIWALNKEKATRKWFKDLYYRTNAMLKENGYKTITQPRYKKLVVMA